MKSFLLMTFITSAMFILFGVTSYGQPAGTLYGSTGNSNQLITINTTTGAGSLVAPISGTAGNVTEIEFRADNVLFGSTGGGNSEIVTINPTTGVATLVGIHAFGAVNGLDFDAGGTLFGAFFNPGISTDLVTVNQTTGALTTIGVIITPDQVTGLTFSPGGILYGVHNSGPATPSSLITINPATGASTLVGAIGFNNVGAIEFGPGGILYGGIGTAGTNPGDLISINPTTGAGTVIGPTGFPGISGLSFNPSVIPVELTSFTADVNDSEVLLSWNTVTEVNNSGFGIERNSGEGFETVGFVPGFGTTTEPHSYNYTDSDVQAGIYTYRLKQIDLDGTFEYSNELAVEVITPFEFALEQNYPNPFNPSTQITYQLAENSNVVLKVYNLLGKEVVVLVEEQKEAGVHKVNFDASSLPGGVYMYRIETAGLVETKKMMLIK